MDTRNFLGPLQILTKILCRNLLGDTALQIAAAIVRSSVPTYIGQKERLTYVIIVYLFCSIGNSVPMLRSDYLGQFQFYGLWREKNSTRERILNGMKQFLIFMIGFLTFKCKRVLRYFDMIQKPIKDMNIYKKKLREERVCIGKLHRLLGNHYSSFSRRNAPALLSGRS